MDEQKERTRITQLGKIAQWLAPSRACPWFENKRFDWPSVSFSFATFLSINLISSFCTHFQLSAMFGINWHDLSQSAWRATPLSSVFSEGDRKLLHDYKTTTHSTPLPANHKRCNSLDETQWHQRCPLGAYSSLDSSKWWPQGNQFLLPWAHVKKKERKQKGKHITSHVSHLILYFP